MVLKIKIGYVFFVTPKMLKMNFMYFYIVNCIIIYRKLFNHYEQNIDVDFMSKSDVDRINFLLGNTDITDKAARVCYFIVCIIHA